MINAACPVPTGLYDHNYLQYVFGSIISVVYNCHVWWLSCK